MCKPKPTLEQIIDILHKELSVKNPTYQNIRIEGKTEAAKKVKELFELNNNFIRIDKELIEPTNFDRWSQPEIKCDTCFQKDKGLFLCSKIGNKDDCPMYWADEAKINAAKLKNDLSTMPQQQLFDELKIQVCNTTFVRETIYDMKDKPKSTWQKIKAFFNYWILGKC